jgi:hypothetical protein
MNAPRVFLMIVAIALAAGIGPALTDAADMTAASLSKAVDALEEATVGGWWTERRARARLQNRRSASQKSPDAARGD